MEQLGLDGPLAWRTIPLVRKRLDFRILGDIADAEIAATGSGIREIARCGSVTAAGGGGSASPRQKRAI